MSLDLDFQSVSSDHVLFETRGQQELIGPVTGQARCTYLIPSPWPPGLNSPDSPDRSSYVHCFSGSTWLGSILNVEFELAWAETSVSADSARSAA